MLASYQLMFQPTYLHRKRFEEITLRYKLLICHIHVLNEDSFKEKECDTKIQGSIGTFELNTALQDNKQKYCSNL